MAIDRELNPTPAARRAAPAAGEDTQAKTHSLAFWAGLGLVLLAGLALRARLLDSFPMSPDEGIHLAWLRLLSAGYRPYTDVYITYPPLYPLAIDAVWRIWPAEAAQRWFSVAYTLFGTVGIALLARRFAGSLAGTAAAALVLFSPPLVEPSRAILGEFPSIAWSVWAIWLAWVARDAQRRRRLLLILSGLCLSASLLTKLLSPFVALLIPLIIFSPRAFTPSPDSSPASNQTSPLAVRHSPIRHSLIHNSQFTIFPSSLLTDLLLWGLAVLIPAILLLFAFDLQPLLRQVVTQRLEARAAYTEDQAFWPPRYERGSMFVREDAALVVLGLAGLGLALARRRKDTWLLLVWLALALAMLAVHNPVRYKHFLILIPPLAVLGGSALKDWIDNLRLVIYDFRKKDQRRGDWGRRGWAWVVALGGLVLLAGLSLYQVPAALALWEEKASAPQPPVDEVEALAFIREVTAPTDCMITDDMQLLYWSGRMAPPELAEVSSNRLESGALTTAELIDISDRYDCQLVAAVSNRIPKYLPEYMEWVEEKYLGRFHYGEDDLFFAKADTDPRPAVPLRADFAGQILFHGYTLPPPPHAPGERLPLTLAWQAQTNIATDYAIFVQLRGTRPDAVHTVLASADHQPYLGLLPTSRWPEGAVIQEVAWLTLPADLPPGDYNIYVGLYHPGTLERLPLAGDSSGENALILGPVSLP